jgi:hypothetical protein
MVKKKLTTKKGSPRNDAQNVLLFVEHEAVGTRRRRPGGGTIPARYVEPEFLFLTSRHRSAVDPNQKCWCDFGVPLEDEIANLERQIKNAYASMAGFVTMRDQLLEIKKVTNADSTVALVASMLQTNAQLSRTAQALLDSLIGLAAS